MNNFWFYVMVCETKHITVYGPYSYDQCIEARNKAKHWAKSPEYYYSSWLTAKNEDEALSRARKFEGLSKEQ